MAELLKMTADTMAAKDAAARLEGGQVRLREELSDVAHHPADAGLYCGAVLAKGLACPSVCRLSFAGDIHSGMSFAATDSQFEGLQLTRRPI
jgi:hypothetical protein